METLILHSISTFFFIYRYDKFVKGLELQVLLSKSSTFYTPLKKEKEIRFFII